MRSVAWLSLLPTLTVAAPPHHLAGTWQANLPKVKVTMVFQPNGGYSSVNVRKTSKMIFAGDYKLKGNTLTLHITSSNAWQNGQPHLTRFDRVGEAQIAWKDENHILISVPKGPTTAFARVPVKH